MIRETLAAVRSLPFGVSLAVALAVWALSPGSPMPVSDGVGKSHTLSTYEQFASVTVPGLILIVGLVTATLIRRQHVLATRLRRCMVIVDGNSDMLALIGADMTVRMANQAWCSALGKDVEDIVGARLADLFEKEWTAKVLEPQLRTSLSGQTGTVATTLDLHGFGKRSCEVQCSPHRDQPGNVAGTVLQIRDVTESRARDRQLRQAHHALDQVQLAVYWISADARLHSANATACDWLQHTREELETMTVFDVDAEFPRHAWSQHWDELRKKRSLRLESVHRRKNGELFPVEIVANMTELDGEEINLAIVQDISERKQQQEALKASEARYRTMFETARVGMALCEMDGTLVDVNQGYLDIIGYTETEAKALTYWDITPRDYEPMEGEQLRQLNEVGKYGPYEKDYITKNGDRVPVLLNGSMVKGSDGREMIWSIVQDISARKRIEEQLRQAQKLEVVGQLTGGMAHDFNNLLNVVQGNLELLRMDPDATDTVKQDYIEDALDGVQRGASLTQRLLAFSRRQTLSPSVTDMNQVVAGMKELLNRTLGEQVELKIREQPNLWPCFVDRSQLENVLLNLCVNARDAMPDGGKLTIDCSNATLSDGYCADKEDLSPGEYVRLTVTDSGTGMDEQTLEQALEPFFTTKSVGQGSGLGLSMVFGFARQSGGHIQIRSAVGSGTTVDFYLPRHRGLDEPAQPEAPATESLPQGREELILLVEDQQELRRVFIKQCNRLGYRTVVAADGDEAVAVFRANPEIRLLLTDIVLPGKLNGKMVAELLLETAPDLKVVYMSGYAEQGMFENRQVDTGDVMLDKPFTLPDLASTLRKSLDATERE